MSGPSNELLKIFNRKLGIFCKDGMGLAATGYTDGSFHICPLVTGDKGPDRGPSIAEGYIVDGSSAIELAEFLNYAVEIAISVSDFNLNSSQGIALSTSKYDAKKHAKQLAKNFVNEVVVADAQDGFPSEESWEREIYCYLIEAYSKGAKENKISPTVNCIIEAERLARTVSPNEPYFYQKLTKSIAAALQVKDDEIMRLEDQLRAIDVGEGSDYLKARFAVAKLSGIPAMAVAYDGHIEAIQKKLNNKEN